MNFGPQVDLATAKKMTGHFIDSGYEELDTAFVYNDGETEKMLGEILPEITRNKFSVATKLNPRITGKLDREAMVFQLNESLRRMGLEYVDVLYLHVPDPVTPISETLEACAELFEQNKFRELGLSNYPAWLVADIWHICDKNSWPKPSVYQGLYNALGRNVEKELFPCLRSFGIRFYAFNPLAGGLLTGKQLEFEAKPEPGRFSRLASYRKRYWKKSYFDAVNHITQVCNNEGIKPAEAAYRWLAFHSMLDSEKSDGIIMGASSMQHFQANLSTVLKNELDDNIIQAFDTAWQETIVDSPDYFYFYGRD